MSSIAKAATCTRVHVRDFLIKDYGTAVYTTGHKVVIPETNIAEKQAAPICKYFVWEYFVKISED